MFSPFERMIAFRYLRARKQEGFVSVITAISFVGIMLGVATLIIVMSVMNGFKEELSARILGLNGHMNIYMPGGVVRDYEPLKQKVEAQNGIRSVIPTVEGQGLINVGGVASGVLVRGISSHDFLVKDSLRQGITAGDIMDFSGNKIAIGYKLAEKFGLFLGDEIVIIAPKGKASPFGTIPRTQRFEIALLFDVGMFEYDSSFIFMPLKTAQKFYRLPSNGVSYLETVLNDSNDLQYIKSQLRENLGENVQLYDWRDANSSFVNALDVERNVMFIILTLIILIAALNIVSSMVMLVIEKSSNIAIMRTVGASRRSMLKIFLLAGACVGVLGTIMGLVLGVSFALNIETIRQWIQGITGTDLFAAEIYFFSQLPSKLDWTQVSLITLVAIGFSMLATLYPAWRAARLDPVEALRYE